MLHTAADLSDFTTFDLLALICLGIRIPVLCPSFYLTKTAWEDHVSEYRITVVDMWPVMCLCIQFCLMSAVQGKAVLAAQFNCYLNSYFIINL